MTVLELKSAVEALAVEVSHLRDAFQRRTVAFAAMGVSLTAAVLVVIDGQRTRRQQLDNLIALLGSRSAE